MMMVYNKKRDSCIISLYHGISSSVSAITGPSSTITLRAIYSIHLPAHGPPGAFRIPPSIRLLPPPGGGLAGRIPPSPCCPFMLATAPPMLTPGLITPAPSVDPRFGFNGDIPDPDNLGPVLVLPGFFFNVEVLDIWLLADMPAVDGAELNVCEGEEKWTEDPEPRSPALS